MKPTKRIFLIMSIVLIPFLAQADFPVSYQGKLANTDGVPISGTVSNTISLYTVIEGGEAVWSESHDNVKVENGILNVILGISTDQSQSLFDTLSRHDTLYYSVSINNSEIKPRSRITGVMFAIRAKIADTVKDLAITSDKIKPDAVTSEKIAPNAVTELKIEDGAVSSEKIQDDAISSQKIQDGAVTVQKISDADGNLSLNNELKVNKGISIKELPPNYSPPAEQGYGKIYAKKGNSSLRQDIIFNWRLDERTGDHIDDAIGFCDATAYSNLTVVPGKLGMAKVFDGQTNYIQENNNTDLDFGTDNFSVSFWMKAERPSGWSAIMSKANDWIESKDVCGWLFGNRDSGSDTLEFRINSCGQDKEHRITHAENVFNNEWHHIVGIRDGETIKLYVDGVLKDTALNVTQSVNVDEPFLIGSVINKYFYSGIIDEVAIWKKALNVDEISDLFNQGNGAAIPDELANLYYKRSDGSEVSLIENENNIFYNEGNVGIGTENPASKLHISGSGVYGSIVKFTNTTSGDNWHFGPTHTDFFTIAQTGIADWLTIMKSNGYVGIGTKSPTSKIHIVGGGDYGSIIKMSNTTSGKNWHLGLTHTDFFTIAQTGINDWLTITQDNGFVGIGTKNPTSKLHISGDGSYGTIIKMSNTTSGKNWHFGLTHTDRFSFAQTGVNDWLTIKQDNGFVGIGTNSPVAKLDVEGNIYAQAIHLQGGDGVCDSKKCYRIYAYGSIYLNGGTYQGSDKRYKKNIIQLNDSLNKVCMLRGVSYEFDTERYPDRSFPENKQIGVIAQELETQYAEMVTEDRDGYKAVSYDKLTAVLIEAIKELRAEKDAEIEALRKRVEALEKQL
jgi:hypothetical protein